MLDRLAAFEIDTQRGAEQGGFYVVGDDGVAPEDDLNVAAADEPRDARARRCMDHRRPEHEEHASATRARRPNLLRDIVNGPRFGTLRRDRILHESELLTLAWPLLG